MVIGYLNSIPNTQYLDFDDFSVTAAPLSNNTFSKTEIDISPNPTTGLVNILTQNDPIIQITIFDLTGRKLKTFVGTSTEEKINIQELPNTVYMLEVKTENGTTTQKLIKK